MSEEIQLVGNWKNAIMVSNLRNALKGEALRVPHSAPDSLGDRMVRQALKMQWPCWKGDTMPQALVDQAEALLGEAYEWQASQRCSSLAPDTGFNADGHVAP